MSRFLYVDWENIWIGLRCKGYSVEPATVVTALVRAAFPDGQRDVQVVVVTKTGIPSRLERRRIEGAVQALTGIEADVRSVRNRKKNAADIELAFLVGRKTCDPDLAEIAIASRDADLVDVGRLAMQEEPNLATTLAYVLRDGERAPEAGRYRLLDILAQPDIGLPPPVASSRSAHEFDRAAWALTLSLNAVQHIDEARARHPDDAPPTSRNEKNAPPPSWWARALDPRHDLQTLDEVDHVLWETQKFFEPGKRRVASLDEATDILRAKFTGCGWTGLAGNAEAIVRALATADLLRLDSHGDLVHRPSLREGILLPIRRAVLIMLVARGSVATSEYLRGRHVKRGYRDVWGEAADESFQHVKAALLSRWHLARADFDRLTVNRTHPLVIDTADKARAIQRVVQGAMTEKDIALAVDAAWFNGRWLRVLTDAQILSHDQTAKTWSPGRFRL